MQRWEGTQWLHARGADAKHLLFLKSTNDVSKVQNTTTTVVYGQSYRVIITHHLPPPIEMACVIRRMGTRMAALENVIGASYMLCLQNLHTIY